MNGQPIPGYYFDKEKKKYFKIQSQVAARGLDLKYSTINLRKEERRERTQQAATARTSKIRKERVVRRYANNFTQTDLEREIGFRRRSFYLQHIWPEACMSGVTATPKSIVSNDSDGAIRFFDRDPVSKTLYAVCGENRVKRRQYLGDNQAVNLHRPQARNKLKALSTKARYSYYPWDEIARTTSTISSTQYMPGSGALAVTTIGSDRAPTIQLSDPERDGPHIHQVFTPKACSAIWTSSARPNTFAPPTNPFNTTPAAQTEHLAVAASQSLLLFTRSPSGPWNTQTALPSLNADILALSWLSPNTLALGCRNGKIHLHDFRSGGSSHILTHPYPISKLSLADDPTRLVCSGLQDTLFLYDIRMPRFSPRGTESTSSNNSNSNSKSKGRGQGTPGSNPAHHYNASYFESLYPEHRSRRKRTKLLHSAYRKWSQPVLSYTHSNVDDLDLDVVVQPRLGLLAAAQDRATCEKAVR
ncbi:hypothetical protein N0V94_009057, partial [Neodidymelliopsis sp. IMI 364377]